jgi:hypothetical protein
MNKLITESEEKIEYSTLIEISAPKVQPEVIEKLNSSPDITPIAFQDKNYLLIEESLQDEIGFIKMPSDGWLVAMRSEMPNVTKEMINWWFWWHVQEPLRYKIWLPREHFDNGYSPKNEDYFKSSYKEFQPNIQYPVERIGESTSKLSIEFVTPEQFGFDEQLFEQNDIETIVCGYVGLMKGKLQHTEMAHIFKKAGNGLSIISRFWMGEKIHFTNKDADSIPNKILGLKILQNKVINRKRAREMAEHCNREYRNLAIILPDLYERYAK